jgi:hypothetical protein
VLPRPGPVGLAKVMCYTERHFVKPCEGFERYFGIFLAAGKPLSEVDMVRARFRWEELGTHDQLAAIAHALRLCSETEARYVPLPENHLTTQAWTRVAMPRSLPRPLKPADQRAIERHNDVLDLLEKRGIS